MNNTYNDLMSKLAAAAGNEILLKAAEVVPPKVRRGRPRKAARILIRADRGGPNGMAYMVGDGRKRSLGITGDNMAAAEASAKLRRMAAEAAAIGLFSPRQVPVEVIFSEYIECSDPGRKGTVEQFSDYRQICRRLKRTLAWLKARTGNEDVTIGEVTPALSQEYNRYLLSQPSRKGAKSGKTMSVGNTRMDLSFARASVNSYNFRHTLNLPNGFWVPERGESRVNWLTRSQIARLLRVCLHGCVWDEQTGRWKVETLVDPTTGGMVMRRKTFEGFQNPDIREEFRQAARAILVLYYTGTRSTRACNLVWDEHPTKGWVDLDRGVIRRSGVKLGNFGGPNRKRKPAGTSILPAPLLRLAHHWRNRDMKDGQTHVFRRADGAEHDQNSLLRLIKKVGSLSGLADIITHEFRHTTVTQCLRAGCSIADTARFVDMSEQMVRTTYGHLAEEATQAGATAMADKRHQPRRSSRDLAADKPRNLLTPQEAMALRKRVKLKPVEHLKV